MFLSLYTHSPPPPPPPASPTITLLLVSPFRSDITLHVPLVLTPIRVFHVYSATYFFYLLAVRFLSLLVFFSTRLLGYFSYFPTRM